MNITLKQLQAFVRIAETGSFAEACQQLNLTQPAVSTSIKNLEDVVGGSLLARTTRKTQLTPEGEAFYPVARRLLNDIDASVDDVKSLFQCQRGKLDIAVMSTFASSAFPAILRQFHQKHPNINVTIHDVIAENVVDMVRKEKVELGITFDPGEIPDIDFQPLIEDRFLAAIPPGHELASHKRLKWNHLKQTHFICLQRPSSIRQQIDSTLEKHDINLSPTFEAHQLITVGKMVAEELGIGVIPEISQEQIEGLGVICRPIIAPSIKRHIGLIQKRQKTLSSNSKAISTLIQDALNIA